MASALVRLLVIASSLPVLLAGCADGEAKDHRLHGAFTTERTQADLDEFQQIVSRYLDGPVALMESFPEQFSLAPLSETDCRALRAELDAKAYIGSLGECTPI